jgi:hypothetical protein
MSVLKNEEQKGKNGGQEGPVWGLVPGVSGEDKERVQEDKYGGNITYSYIKVEKMRPPKLF